MRKEFYDFVGPSFRSDLEEFFIAPAAHWLSGNDALAYVLPQVSGSNWECSLTIEFLLNVKDYPTITDDDRVRIRTKTLATARWMLGRIETPNQDEANWDGVPWDTAVCLRTIMRVSTELRGDFSPHELTNIADCIRRVTNWLVRHSFHWDTEIRYAAGPADLGQVLRTLIEIAREHSHFLRAAEASVGMLASESIVDEIARLLLAMEERSDISVPDGDPAEVSYWVDAFNSSEVIDALAHYLLHCGSTHRWGATRHDVDCKAAVIRALQYIELTQSDGTWGGVADTCGTLYGYLVVNGMMANVKHEDDVVFRALRWMCDEKQSLPDGSFLHTSYVTVFYALALSECYRSWPLGTRRASEVYDVVLWSAPSSATVERSRRLNVQIQLENLAIRRGAEYRRAARFGRSVWGVLIAILLVGISFVLLIVSGAISASASFSAHLRRADIFWAVCALSVPLIISAVGGYLALMRSRALQEASADANSTIVRQR
ncbi:MAG: hypothetical protein JWN95_438 [Frankiales bacterium]|nr:hypothetical protein [Frankiales bacterium]